MHQLNTRLWKECANTLFITFRSHSSIHISPPQLVLTRRFAPRSSLRSFFPTPTQTVLTVLGETYSAVGDGLTAEGLYSSSSDAFFNLESQAQTILSRIHLSKVEIKLYASWERREGDIARLENRIEADTEKLGLGWRQILKDDDVEEKVKILSGLNI